MYDKLNILYIDKEERGWDDDMGYWWLKGNIWVLVGVVKDGGFILYIGKREVVNYVVCFESNFF